MCMHVRAHSAEKGLCRCLAHTQHLLISVICDMLADEPVLCVRKGGACWPQQATTAGGGALPGCAVLLLTLLPRPFPQSPIRPTSCSAFAAAAFLSFFFATFLSPSAAAAPFLLPPLAAPSSSSPCAPRHVGHTPRGTRARAPVSDVHQAARPHV